MGTVNSSYDLTVGDCETITYGDSSGPALITEMEVVNCSDPRTSQSHTDPILSTDDAFPGSDSVSDTSGTMRTDVFQDWSGTEWDTSDYWLGWVSPIETRWADGEKRAMRFLEATGNSTFTGDMMDAKS